MPADEPRKGASSPRAGGGTPPPARERTSAADGAGADAPRHAAPRKPLLTRLHLPAGKAIAIAAMPSAVLMGMGLTPQLALAKPQSQSPFSGGPCVSAPDSQDSPGSSASPKGKGDAPDKSAGGSGKTDTADKSGKSAGKDDARSKSSTDGGAGAKDSSTGSTSRAGSEKAKESASPSPDASPSPSPSASSGGADNPWDPLGLGKALHGVLHPGGSSTASGSPSPTATPSGSGSKDSGSSSTTTGTSHKTTSHRTAASDKDPSDKSTSSGKDGKGSGASPGASPSPSPSASATGTGGDGKKPFPCVVEKKSAGKDEQTPVTLPNEPWHLDASSLTLRQLKYEGVVNVRTADGSTKQVLKFTADSVDIGDLHQTYKGQDGKTYHVQAAKGSTSKFTDGPITMYTERLKGNLFGLIPITFDPEHPPPIPVSYAVFTQVSLDQAGQFGGNLHVPGLHMYTTG